MKAVGYNSDLRRQNALAMWAKRTPQDRLNLARKIGVANKGKRRSDEQRETLRSAHLGHIPWNKGRKETRPEVLERLRVSHLGKIRTQETRDRQAASMRGKICSETTRRKIGEKHKGKVIPESMREVLRRKCSGWAHSQSAKARISAASRSKWADSGYKAWVGKNIQLAKTSVEGRAKCSLSSKQSWADPESRIRRMAVYSRPDVRKKLREAGARGLQSVRRKPNGLEKSVALLLDSMAPGRWRYNGGGLGSKKIACRFPDFVYARQKKLIEVDGEYWHTNPKKDQQRNMAYRQAGFQVFVLKSSKIDDPATLVRLRNFCHV